MIPVENKAGVISRVDTAIAGRSSIERFLYGCVYWLFPLILTGIGFLIGQFIPAFRESAFSKWPIDPTVWAPLVILMILAIIWLLFDLFWVFSRETTSRNLQVNSSVTSLMAVGFSVAFGYLINSKSGLPWWFVVPFCTAVVDEFTTSWAAINNATQKPFMTERGRV
ncbi:MAG: hypothetical protein WBG50_03610 [Desulfomonilaceae bacterium]